MRLGFCLLPATLAAGFSFLALPYQLSAQLSSSAGTAVIEPPEAPQPQGNASNQQTGSISGTAVDANGGVIPDATVILEGAVPADRRAGVTNGSGFFNFTGLKPGVPYRVTIRSNGFVDWTSPVVTLVPGQYEFLTNCALRIAGGVTSVTVYSSTEQFAMHQVRLEEQQRILGLIPNFYVVYDPNPAPLTTKLKFQLALKVSIDPITALGVGAMAGIKQAANTPDYVQGAKGYGQRLGTDAADDFSDIMIGGAILPSLLHQDPRYFYQGTGTIRSRTFHALASPFVCKGDNGRQQPNYSTIGGDLGSAAISNIYYPQSNRGVNLVFTNLLIETAERMTSDLAQEFILRKFTSKIKDQD